MLDAAKTVEALRGFNILKGGAFRGFNHIGYVTNNLEKAVETFDKMYGCPDITMCGEHPVTLRDGRIYWHKTAMVYVEPWGIEIITPTSGADDIYRQIMPPESEGFGMKLHHVCFSCATLEELEDARQGFVRAGCRIANDSVYTNFFYADTRALFGHYTEWAHMGDFEQGMVDNMKHYAA